MLIKLLGRKIIIIIIDRLLSNYTCRSIVRNTYFLDSMCPTHHIFLMRNLIEVQNVAVNKTAILATQAKLKMCVSVDRTGRLFTTGGY